MTDPFRWNDTDALGHMSPFGPAQPGGPAGGYQVGQTPRWANWQVPGQNFQVPGAPNPSGGTTTMRRFDPGYPGAASSSGTGTTTGSPFVPDAGDIGSGSDGNTAPGRDGTFGGGIAGGQAGLGAPQENDQQPDQYGIGREGPVEDLGGLPPTREASRPGQIDTSVPDRGPSRSGTVADETPAAPQVDLGLLGSFADAMGNMGGSINGHGTAGGITGSSPQGMGQAATVNNAAPFGPDFGFDQSLAPSMMGGPSYGVAITSNLGDLPPGQAPSPIGGSGIGFGLGQGLQGAHVDPQVTTIPAGFLDLNFERPAVDVPTVDVPQNEPDIDRTMQDPTTAQDIADKFGKETSIADPTFGQDTPSGRGNNTARDVTRDISLPDAIDQGLTGQFGSRDNFADRTFAGARDKAQIDELESLVEGKRGSLLDEENALPGFSGKVASIEDLSSMLGNRSPTTSFFGNPRSAVDPLEADPSLVDQLGTRAGPRSYSPNFQDYFESLPPAIEENPNPSPSMMGPALAANQAPNTMADFGPTGGIGARGAAEQASALSASSPFGGYGIDDDGMTSNTRGELGSFSGAMDGLSGRGDNSIGGLGAASGPQGAFGTNTANAFGDLGSFSDAMGNMGGTIGGMSTSMESPFGPDDNDPGNTMDGAPTGDGFESRSDAEMDADTGRGNDPGTDEDDDEDDDDTDDDDDGDDDGGEA